MRMKLLVPILVLLVFVVIYGCQSGIQSGSCCGQGGGQQAYFFNIEKLISDSSGGFLGIDGFGTEFGVPAYISPPAKTTTNVTDNGALLIEPGGWITIDIPEQFRNGGYLLEFHILYDTNENYDNTEAHFLLRDDGGNDIALGALHPNAWVGKIDAHQTFTLQADLTNFAGTSSVTLYNTYWGVPEPTVPDNAADKLDELPIGSNLEINNYMAILPIETKNDANIFIADIRPASNRFISESGATIEAWDTEDGDVNTPDNFWGEDTGCCSADIDFNLSDVISTMTQPVLEFNYGRSSADSGASEVYLYGDSDQIIHVNSNDESYEDMGQTAIVDLTPWQNSSFFRLNINLRTWLNPFLKIYDAAANSSAVLLDVKPPVPDVSPAGREYISHSGKFLFYLTEDDYPVEGMWSQTVEYDGPHWLADPTYNLNYPYGVEGTLVFSIPPAVRSFNHPVMEIMHFAVDSNTNTFDSCFEETASPGQEPVEELFRIPGCPDYYPVEFYLRDEDNNEIAHVFFDESDQGAGGMLKNQIPIEEFKDSATMSIVVPGVDNDRWSQMAFPPFIKIFDSIN